MPTKTSKRIYGYLALIGSTTGLGCSFLLGEMKTSNCTTNQDCVNLAATNKLYNGSLCIDSVCALPESALKDSGPDTTPECVHNVDCSKALGGAPAVCVKNPTETHCAPLEGSNCVLATAANIKFPNWVDDESIIVAHIERPDAQPHNLHSLWSSSLAFSEINRFGIPSVTGGLVQRIVKLDCSYAGDTAPAMIDHLSRAGVAGVIGVGQSEASLQIVPLAVAANIFTLATRVVSSTFTSQDDQGLFWRVSPPSTYEAIALNRYMPKLETEVRAFYPSPGGIPADSLIKLTLIAQTGNYGDSMANTFRPQLSFNQDATGGPSSTASAGLYEDLSFTQGVDGHDATAMVNALLVSKPHIIVYLGGTELLSGTGVVSRVEKAWTETKYRPFWVFAGVVAADPIGIAGPSLALANLPYPNMKERLRGVWSDPFRHPQFEDFLANFDPKFGFTPGFYSQDTHYAYDAAYFLAYAHYAAMVAKKSPRLTGRDVKEGAKLLLPSGIPKPFEVGPGSQDERVQEIFTALSSGASIDLQGTSGTLDFNPNTGEIDGNTTRQPILCAGTCTSTTHPPCTVGSGVPVLKESGLTWVPKPPAAFEGSYSCP